MPDFTIIVPAFNEGPAIKDNIEDAVRTLEGQGFDFEIVAVNDGSGDDTWTHMQAAAGPRVKAVGYDDNRGMGHAVKHGFQHSEGRLVMYMGADLDVHPRQMQIFLDAFENQGADIVLGSKHHPDSKLDWPASRKFLGKSYNLLIRILFGLKLMDTQGPQMFTRESLEYIFPKVTTNSYAFSLEMLVIASKKGYKIVEVPITVEFKSKSSRNLGRMIRLMLSDTLKVFRNLRFKKMYRPE